MVAIVSPIKAIKHCAVAMFATNTTQEELRSKLRKIDSHRDPIYWDLYNRFTRWSCDSSKKISLESFAGFLRICNQ
jgi:hypothetical protein